MKLVAWNCRGLGSRLVVCSLLELQKKENADILFLSEMKLDKRRIEKFWWMLGLTN
jgi:exonuclease III